MTLNVDYCKLRVRAGDFIESEAEALLRSANAPQHAVKAYQEYASGRKALVFTAGVKLAHEMAEAFCQAGIYAEALDANTPPQERQTILQRFKGGAISALCNCGLLTEGYDEPSIDCIIMARPTRSKVLYMQCLGRATRLFPGKDNALILDLVGATDRHDLITAPVLFGLERKRQQLATKTLTEVLAQVEAKERVDVRAPKLDGELVARRVNLFAHKTVRLRWIRVDARHYILPLGEGYLALEGNADQTKWSLLKMADGRIDIVTRNLSLGWAQGRGNDLACSLGAGGLNNPYGKWREKPASQGQLQYLGWLHVPTKKDMTAGEAFDEISKAKFRKVWQAAVKRVRVAANTKGLRRSV